MSERPMLSFFHKLWVTWPGCKRLPNEAVGIRLAPGSGLIFLGIAMVNTRLQRFFARQPAAEQVAKP